MKALPRVRCVLGAVVSVAFAADAAAQPGLPAQHLPQPVAQPAGGLRAHVGLDVAIRLMRSTNPDERLRGLERAASIHTPEALALLLRAGGVGSGGADPRLPAEGISRVDPRALLAVVRGLAQWSERENARSALAAIVSAPGASFRTTASASPDPSDDDAVGARRIFLARQQAALALATSGSPLAIEALVAIARGGGPGQAPALDALGLHPPTGPFAFGGVALTTPPMVALAIRVGDLRVLDAILGLVRASDPALRAAAISALGVVGDARGVDFARAAARDPDPQVRVAAAASLVHGVAPDASQVVEALVADDLTVADGLRLANEVQDEGVIRAVAARTLSADGSLRAAAVASLGRQSSPSAVRALQALASDPSLAGDVAHALARSPSPAALGAIESMGGAPSVRRLAARAYFVRAFVRGQRSRRLDALVLELARSADAADRALATQVRVALGQQMPEAALADPDPRVRRAAAMGVVAAWGERGIAMLLGRFAAEPDETTRVVLSIGLIRGDPEARWPMSSLLESMRSGRPDAMPATLALARRADEVAADVLEQALASRDPVIRAHVARGLGLSAAPEAPGRLSEVYAWEADVEVRRAVIDALSVQPSTRSSPAVARTLALAAALDPDALVRWTARRALSGAPSAGLDGEAASAREVAWIRIAAAPGAVALRDETGLLVRSDGLAVPIVFDDDGYALVPGIPPGEARLRLAPRLPVYFAGD